MSCRDTSYWSLAVPRELSVSPAVLSTPEQYKKGDQESSVKRFFHPLTTACFLLPPATRPDVDPRLVAARLCDPSSKYFAVSKPSHNSGFAMRRYA
ncbi:unnamed protein product [Jaminaea pallidilutea]